jgi:type VI secretion system secreted protein VgrG
MSTVMARMMELTTPVGKDLLFHTLRGREELGRSSEFELSALSTRNDIKPSDLLGKSITVKLELVKGGFRYFNGYVTRFAQGETLGRYFEYRMTVHSWLWFLTRTADCKIFQEKTVPDIIKEVFGDHKMAVFEDALTASYQPREYCVQYRETDFAFVSRLMEEEGIYYYFEHSDGKHSLKLVDSDSGHKKLEGKSSIAYHLPGRALHGDEEYIQAFRQGQSIKPGIVATRSYDFGKPKADLGVKAQNVEQHQSADYEVYDYAGDYIQTDNGDHLARVRIEELHSEFELAEAECNVREVAVGRLFKLTNAPRKDQEKDYLIVKAEWDLQNNTYETNTDEEAIYRCTMTVLQSKQQFRPARVTPRPTMGGPQTAVVTGPGGEEIYCDKYGRVKVQFHWDRYGKKNENSSCWIRVSSPWAGAKWGGISIPRIGQEVVVDFLEGDPDQPLITGRVYNADNMPPYGLPGAKVVSGMKSNSTKGGGGYNEMSFDDTKGTEKITIHGQYDMNTTVEHDQTSTIHNNRTDKVDVDDSETVGNNQTQKVGVNQTVSIGSNRSVTIGSNKSETIGGAKAETIALAKALSIGAAYQVSVGAAMNETIGGLKAEEIGGAKIVAVGAISSENVGSNKSVNAGGNISENAGGNISSSAASNISASAGSNIAAKAGSDISESAGANFSGSAGSKMSFSSGADYSVDSKAKVVIVAASEMTLKCGSASITLKSGGEITIKGTDITIDGSGKIGVKAGGDMTLKGSKIGAN